MNQATSAGVTLARLAGGPLLLNIESAGVALQSLARCASWQVAQMWLYSQEPGSMHFPLFHDKQIFLLRGIDFFGKRALEEWLKLGEC